MPTTKTADTIKAARQDPAVAKKYRTSAEAAFADATEAENDAHREATRAANHVDELERRVAAGDLTISASDLGDAREGARLAALRTQAFPAKTSEAQREADRARLFDTCHELAALDARWNTALDETAAAAVKHLTTLLAEYSAVTDDLREVTRHLGGGHADDAADAPAGTVHYRPREGFVPAMQLPDIDELIGELLAAAFERAFGHLGIGAFGTTTLQGKVRQMTGTAQRSAPTETLDLIEGRLGPRQDPPQPSRHGMPKYVTVERA
ncbi:hypothetical protein [Actinophytocola oryzae]|uniref:Uncharacterized protein n=1 Tax=Actinophytocola oryzae TaxID=502181 RepID=A0A4R7UTW9_9PSEU|nr:hypothetical protein [Actinophytocola oryzae]TDV40118.1 hypothetical protein CLV71_124137 [Actinophytocola oryzae]